MTTKKLPNLSRLEKIIGEEKIEKIKEKTVLVLGCGGVGGYVVEALARSGVGKLIIIDFDKVEESNVNRQIIALTSTIGMNKVDALEKRILDINPNCIVIKKKEFISEDNVEELFNEKIDYFVDACDTVNTKKLVLLECLNKKVPFLMCMGTGNKLDPTKLEIIDIRKTVNDPLARIMRKFVKDKRIKGKVMVCTSSELPIKIHNRTPGSSAFVPSSAGLLMASYIIREFIK